MVRNQDIQFFNNECIPILNQMQTLAQEYNVPDISHHVAIRTLQILMHCKLKAISGIHDNDAFDPVTLKEYEIKTADIKSLNAKKPRDKFQIGTINTKKLYQRYINVDWIFGICDGFYLQKVFLVKKINMRPWLNERYKRQTKSPTLTFKQVEEMGQLWK